MEKTGKIDVKKTWAVSGNGPDETEEKCRFVDAIYIKFSACYSIFCCYSSASEALDLRPQFRYTSGGEVFARAAPHLYVRSIE